MGVRTAERMTGVSMSDLRKAKPNYSENRAREEFAGPVSDHATIRKLKFGSTSKSRINMHTRLLHPHDGANFVSLLQKSFCRYVAHRTVDSDASFQRRLAGHV